MDRSDPLDPSFESMTAALCERIIRNRAIRRKLPGRGHVHMDRQLPFLCVHRRSADGRDLDSAHLITTQASYLIAATEPEHQGPLRHLMTEMVQAMLEHVGAFLVLEVWPAPVPTDPPPLIEDWHQPRFHIVTQRSDSLPAVVETLQESLAEIQLSSLPAEVNHSEVEQLAPPGLPPLLSGSQTSLAGCFVVGLEVTPIYRDPATGTTFPLVLKMLREQLSRALKRTFCAFAGMKLEDPPEHYDALGPRALLEAVGVADRLLGEVAADFDFVLLATPVNTTELWQEFERKHFDWEPMFRYRPLPFNPNLLKRELFKIRLEAIEDPTLAHLLTERHQELDRQITMLGDRGTRDFLYGSLQLYGPVEDSLVQTAHQLLDVLPKEGRQTPPGERVDAKQLRFLAEAECRRYRSQNGFKVKIEMRDDIASGVMVSGDRLLISNELQMAKRRVRPLLHHEIGTHLLTYFNGRQQPLRQLATGLAGYETLQEGLAVLAEYLSGGLQAARMRKLAARVLGCRSVADGATFVETFRLLRTTCRLPRRTAFTTAVRCHRGGGLTKDAIYLRGLIQLLEYLQRGHRLDPLYVGKIALEHVPFIQELRRREIVAPAAIRPRYLDHPAARRRLDACRRMSLIDLAARPSQRQAEEPVADPLTSHPSSP